MYDVTIKTGFAAAHQLRLYDGKYENLHGHNWTAQVTVEADELDAIGAVSYTHLTLPTIYYV